MREEEREILSSLESMLKAEESIQPLLNACVKQYVQLVSQGVDEDTASEKVKTKLFTEISKLDGKLDGVSVTPAWSLVKRSRVGENDEYEIWRRVVRVCTIRTKRLCVELHAEFREYVPKTRKKIKFLAFLKEPRRA